MTGWSVRNTGYPAGRNPGSSVVLAVEIEKSHLTGRCMGNASVYVERSYRQLPPPSRADARENGTILKGCDFAARQVVHD